METIRHHGRVAGASLVIGRALGLGKDALCFLGGCAALHDVGKRFIPPDILYKPGPLNDSEWDVMKTHTLMGAEYIEDILDEPHALLTALTHHERHDGRGYPLGLTGQDIPLYSRIVSLADMFDALISKRCYKPAYPFRQAVEIIQSERGRRFDPRIVDVFLEHLEPGELAH